MAYQQFGSSNNQPTQLTKKRIREEDSVTNTKRFFDLNTTFSPELPKPVVLPSITYASPDYRPPPSDEIPFWLQPTTTNSPNMAEDSEEDELLTPQIIKPSHDYWEDMTIDQ